jgi:hypothetical protein
MSKKMRFFPYFVKVSQDVANDRKARKDASEARTKGHVSVLSAEDVAHQRYMRSMGL